MLASAPQVAIVQRGVGGARPIARLLHHWRDGRPNRAAGRRSCRGAEGRLGAQSGWRAKLAQSIATGIINYKGLVDNMPRPMMVADYRRQFDGQLVLRDANAPAKAESSPAPAVIPTSN